MATLRVIVVLSGPDVAVQSVVASHLVRQHDFRLLSADDVSALGTGSCRVVVPRVSTPEQFHAWTRQQAFHVRVLPAARGIETNDALSNYAQCTPDVVLIHDDTEERLLCEVDRLVVRRFLG